jgi:hypothetical protein
MAISFVASQGSRATSSVSMPNSAQLLTSDRLLTACFASVQLLQRGSACCKANVCEYVDASRENREQRVSSSRVMYMRVWCRLQYAAATDCCNGILRRNDHALCIDVGSSMSTGGIEMPDAGWVNSATHTIKHVVGIGLAVQLSISHIRMSHTVACGLGRLSRCWWWCGQQNAWSAPPMQCTCDAATLHKHI